MRLQFQRWHAAAGFVALCAAAAGAFYVYRSRGQPATHELTSYLPAANATVVFIDVDAIRRSGILNLAQSPKAAEELEYREFVDQTQFDYRRDLDSVALAFRDGQVFIAARGHFHWKNLADYAVRQGGSCHEGYCVAPGSQPERRISFREIGSGLMAMGIGSDDFAAYQVTLQASAGLVPPQQPLWAVVPAAALQDSSRVLPEGAKRFASALQGADQIQLTIGPEGDHLQLGLQVTCRDAASASALNGGLEKATSSLREWIAKEHPRADAADLSGVLLAGTFRRNDRYVYGHWPIGKDVVDALAGGSQ